MSVSRAAWASSLSFFLFSAAQPIQTVPTQVITTLKEVRDVASTGDEIWPGFSSAPFGFLYVGDIGEVLLCDHRIPDGFTRSDPIDGLECNVATGPSSWRKPFLLASMPAFGPGEVIVMGSPEATQQELIDWRRTVLHEHFHQWQGHLPDFYSKVKALDLSGGDTSGMWMINYAFPYEERGVGDAYREAATKLLAALNADSKDLDRATAAYWAARQRFADSVTPEQWRYYDFQLWKEGVARWTEVEIARKIGGDWRENADNRWAEVKKELANASLADAKRITVYAYGAAEAALLERHGKSWRACYQLNLTMTPCWKQAGFGTS